MDERTYGLIVEGIYDEAVYPELVHRIASADAEIVVRQCRGVSNLMMRLPGYLSSLEIAWYGKPVDKAIVIRDWHHPDLPEAEHKMAAMIQNRQFRFPRGIQLCAVRQEMETWLLADASAVSAVAAQRGGRRVSEIHGQLEEISDAKEALIKLLSEAKLPYDPKVCAEIARNTSLETLRYRCAAFRDFEQKVIDC